MTNTDKTALDEKEQTIIFAPRLKKNDNGNIVLVWEEIVVGKHEDDLHRCGGDACEEFLRDVFNCNSVPIGDIKIRALSGLRALNDNRIFREGFISSLFHFAVVGKLGEPFALAGSHVLGGSCNYPDVSIYAERPLP